MADIPTQRSGPLTDQPPDPSASDGETLLVALGCALFVLFAVGIEGLSGYNANSPLPGWLEGREGIVPSTWPVAARVGWWLAVATAAGGFRVLLARAGARTRRWVTFLVVAPFVGFAVGIAVGAEWTTWH